MMTDTTTPTLDPRVSAWDELLTGWTRGGPDGQLIVTYRAPGQSLGIAAGLREHGNHLNLRARVDYGRLEAGYDYTLDQARLCLAPSATEKVAIADADLEHELQRLRTRRDARRLLDAEEAVEHEMPAPTRLDAFLAVDDPDAEYRIDGLLPTGGNALLAAQHKAGKSTLVANLLRAVADGEAFLDRHGVRAARVGLIDNELDPRTLRRWLADQSIRSTESVTVVNLRGRVASFDILNDRVREMWAARLRGVDVLVFDCLRPALDALGLDENHDAGRFLVALDALKAEAGIDELIVVHHMGHSGERSRGDSRILDWPDAIWKIVREKPDDTASPRYFSAFGRDVDVHESRLDYDASTRRLSTKGLTKVDAAIDVAAAWARDLLTEHTEGLSQQRIEDAWSGADERPPFTKSNLREGLHLLNARAETVIAPGARGAKIHILVHLASSPDLASTSPAN